MNKRENFKTKTQWKRWLEYQAFFENIIKLQKEGKTIWINDGDENRILGEIVFFQYCTEWHIRERMSKSSFVTWVGFTTNPKECNLLYIDDSLAKLKKKYKFKYFEKEVLL